MKYPHVELSAVKSAMIVLASSLIVLCIGCSSDNSPPYEFYPIAGDRGGVLLNKHTGEFVYVVGNSVSRIQTFDGFEARAETESSSKQKRPSLLSVYTNKQLQSEVDSLEAELVKIKKLALLLGRKLKEYDPSPFDSSQLDTSLLDDPMRQDSVRATGQ